MGNSEEPARYDYSAILNHLLDSHILWSEDERRAFKSLPNNLEYLETGKEDLWSAMRRMTGKRIEICPFYADQDELFEAFMYHSPQDGAVYKEIIDSWIEKNEPKKREFLSLAEKVVDTSVDRFEKELIEEIALQSPKKEFLNRFDESEKFLVEMALRANPAYLEIDTLVESMYGKLDELIQAPENQRMLSAMRTDSKEVAVDKIRKRVKELRMSLTISSEFEKNIASEEDMNVLMRIRVLLLLKMPDRILGYTRHEILCDSRYWNQWREETH